ncbi:pyruvate dehydrogenase E1 component subunit alpha-3, chloroplastic [Trifolium repens]|nr:pyruvate dehydrogenase E1 component subunit alpha-3, chloroplastic [Trifolium repens]
MLLSLPDTAFAMRVIAYAAALPSRDEPFITFQSSCLTILVHKFFVDSTPCPLKTCVHRCNTCTMAKKLFQLDSLSFSTNKTLLSLVSTYRDHVHALSKGVPARAVMSELFGKATGCCWGQGGSMHIFSKEHNVIGGFAFIGKGIPIATGAAFSSKYRRDVLKEPDADYVTLAFFGDGTCNNGQFYECLNMAVLWNLPIIFVVENNLWAIGMSHLRATSDREIWKKGLAFGMPGVHVDGMDVLKVREVAKEAIGRARRGEGPTLIECETYRFRGHSLADPDELRNPAEKAHYAGRDPISALKKYIIENKLASEQELKTIEKKIDEVIEEAVEFAKESPVPPRSQLLENVFADPKGFGIGPDGRYRCEDPKFTQGTAHV